MEKKINEEEKEATLEDIVKNDYQGATIVELNIPTKKNWCCLRSSWI